jgi:hypothetical protein
MDNQPVKKRFSAIQVMEATAAAVLAAAVIGTAGGMSWLIIRLPSHLAQLEKNITQILENQKGFETRFTKLDETVKELDRRVIRLEVD